MEKVLSIQQLLLRSRRLPWMIAGLGLVVLAGAIGLTTLRLRDAIRAQIAGRDGEVLYAVALMQYAEEAESGLADPITDPGTQLTVMLKASQLKGVMGIRLFQTNGEPVQLFPPELREGNLDRAFLRDLQSLQPVSRYHPGVLLDDLFYTAATNRAAAMPRVPVLEVNVPLHAQQGSLAGIAQFLLEGQSIAAQFSRLDRHLSFQALTGFIVSGGLLSFAIAWAFRRLRRASRLLTERTENLIRANQELALAAKMTAVGAVAAHLIHGLKNPLAGLQSFVAAHTSGQPASGEADWDEAAAITRRMQALVNQVVGVLREEQAGTRYEVTLDELIEMVANRIHPLSREAGVSFTARAETEAVLPNRVAHLVALILTNLCQNGLQASPAGTGVSLTVTRETGKLLFTVGDQGPGFPKDQPLFLPCRSSKEGGSGIGLALCKQLANHLGAELELESTSPAGCAFALRLPETLLTARNDGEAVTLVG
jgi:signal transduction histidine kinase